MKNKKTLDLNVQQLWLEEATGEKNEAFNLQWSKKELGMKKKATEVEKLEKFESEALKCNFCGRKVEERKKEQFKAKKMFVNDVIVENGTIIRFR